MASSDRLEPVKCYFCQSLRVAVEQLALSRNRARLNIGLSDFASFVECLSCRARGPLKYGDGPGSRLEAVLAWNLPAQAVR